MKIGLLPLYIKLYDDASPHYRPRVESFYALIARELEKKGLEVVTCDICRVRAEFAGAVEKFEREDVDALVTLHLAYSPSLESSDVLAETKLPVIVLDTTPTYEFDPSISSAEISYNHGIHGVQDMCNLLRRNNKAFEICAGHYERSDVLDRVVSAVKGAKLARTIRHSKVGIVGKPFEGMGDFAVPFDELKRAIGIQVVQTNGDDFPAVTPGEIEAEYARDTERFDAGAITYEDYASCERVALKVRKWIEENSLNAFTMNFLSTKAGTGFDCIPFTEACKAMARGIGYAGEGDVMTAAFVGALLSVYEETTFCEMFCPDWAGDTIYISHMGEYNLKCAKYKPKYVKYKFPYTDAVAPTALISVFKPSDAIFTCLAPAANGEYTLILSKCRVLPAPSGTSFDTDVSGWFKPPVPVADFLEAYSKNGGIHHGAMVYGGELEVMRAFGAFMGWKIVVIKAGKQSRRVM